MLECSHQMSVNLVRAAVVVDGASPDPESFNEGEGVYVH